MVNTIAIAGISSRLALLIAEELLKQASIDLRGSCRDLQKLPQWLRDDCRISLLQTGAYERENLRSLVAGCDVVICCYLADNNTMFEAQKFLIDVCEENGVARYIASDYTADYTKLNYGDVVIKDPMKQIKAYLEESKVTGVHILVGLFLDSYWELFGFWDPKDKSLSYWGSGNERWELTSYRTTAQFVAAVALDAEAKGLLKFLGDRKSTFEIADDFEFVYGLRPILKKLGTLEDLKARQDMGNGQQNPFAAGSYHLLSGHWPVGDDPQNLKYPDITPESCRDYFKISDVISTHDSNTFQNYFKRNKVLDNTSSSGVGSSNLAR